MATYVVLLGPPGAGKGTQSEVLSRTMNLKHISSGDLFRENIKNQTELGKLARSYIDKGELVPDDVTIAMIRERISCPDCKDGAILDGFPRTPTQADALEKTLTEFDGQVSAVYITAEEAVLIERTSGRWLCRQHGHVYHEKFNPPKQVGVCDVDASELYQRDDDHKETVTNRIRVYFEQTMPLVEYYRQRGKLIEVNGVPDVDKVTSDLLTALKK
jgi:adenylate kinase